MSGLILASKSATRLQLLRNAGLDVQVQGSDVDEEAAKVELLAGGATPKTIAGALAEAKALAVSSRRPGLVIGADQTLDLDGRLFDKVTSMEAAKARLLLMRGLPHRLHTAAVVARDGAVVWRAESSPTLRMRAFTDAFLDNYLKRNGEALLSSVGCYQLEGEGLQLFDAIEGDYFAILGLPLVELMNFLRSVGEIAP